MEFKLCCDQSDLINAVTEHINGLVNMVHLSLGANLASIRAYKLVTEFNNFVIFWRSIDLVRHLNVTKKLAQLNAKLTGTVRRSA